MIATGNHNFERFAALCNTLSGEPRRLRRSGRLRASPTGAGETIGYQQQTKRTPSASLRSAAPSKREPRRLRRSGSPSWRPLRWALQRTLLLPHEACSMDLQHAITAHHPGQVVQCLLPSCFAGEHRQQPQRQGCGSPAGGKSSQHSGAGM